MKFRSDPPLSQQISSNRTILYVAILLGVAVFIAAILLQWIVYDDWLHRRGLRLVGSMLAGLLMFGSAYRWQAAVRERKLEMLRRFKTIARMNDRIRNALQVIECATYAANPQATEPVRSAVDVIEGVLEEVLVDAHPAPEEASGESPHALSS
jgi:hypothetical protein